MGKKSKMTAAEAEVLNTLRNDGMGCAAAPMTGPPAGSAASVPTGKKRKKRAATMRTHRTVT